MEEFTCFLRGRRGECREDVCRQGIRNTSGEESGSHEELRGLQRDCKSCSTEVEKRTLMGQARPRTENEGHSSERREMKHRQSLF